MNLLSAAQLSQCDLAPAVVGKIAALEKLSIFFFPRKVVVEVAADLFRYYAALSGHRLHDIGDTVFFEYVLETQGNLAVSCKGDRVDRLFFPQKADGHPQM